MQTIEPAQALRGNHAVLEAYLNLGRQLMDEHQPEAALSPLEKVLQARPDNSQALAIKAEALADLGQQEQAAGLFADLLKLEARPEYFIGRARCLAALEKTAEALTCIDLGRVSLGEMVELEMEAIRYERALKRYEQALERNLRLIKAAGEDVALLELRGDIYLDSGNRAEALKAYQHALHELQELPQPDPSAISSLEGKLSSLQP
jgi:tetratricopeptide (TPR) repeat protein